MRSAMQPEAAMTAWNCKVADQGLCVTSGTLKAVGVVEPLELAQSVQEMALVSDQGSIQQFTLAGLHPPLHDRVHYPLVGLGRCNLDTALRLAAVLQRLEK